VPSSRDVPAFGEAVTADVGSWGDDPIRLGLPQRTFGVLIDLAGSTVEHYRSDFYHDAQWIEKHVAGECTFFYGFDPWGTAIGSDLELVRASRHTVFRVDIHKTDRKAWVLTAILEGAP
jgi:hypothetical protein